MTALDRFRRPTDPLPAPDAAARSGASGAPFVARPRARWFRGRFRGVPVAILIAAIWGAIPGSCSADPGTVISIESFVEELRPFGQWVPCPYGKCWVPRGVGADWQPFSNGRWIFTDYGWTFASAERFGGTPEHYGTWTVLVGHGWAWVPDTTWAPAWVTWCWTEGYVGWAPIPPGARFGPTGSLRLGAAVDVAHWTFVPTARFLGGDVRSARIPAVRNVEIARGARFATGLVVSGGVVRNRGLSMESISRAGGGFVEARSLADAGTVARSSPPEGLRAVRAESSRGRRTGTPRR